MIQPTTLLPLAPTPSQGAVRQLGGGAAFVLQGEGDAATGDPTLLADDGGERQDDAAGGNGLPIAAATVDPWLIAVMAAPLAAPSPTSADATVASPSVTRTDGPSASSPGAAAVPPILAVDATGTLATAASSVDEADTVPGAATSDSGRPAADPRTMAGIPKASAAGPIARVADRARDGAGTAVLPQQSAIDPTGVLTGRRAVPPPTIARARVGGETATQNASTLRPGAASTTDDDPPVPVSASVDGDPTARAEPTPAPPAPERSRSDRTAPAPGAVDALPAAALASSALTPLHRREIAAVADLIDRSAASVPTAPAAPSTSSTRPDGLVLPATFAAPSPAIRPSQVTTGRTAAPVGPAPVPPVSPEGGASPDRGANDAPPSTMAPPTPLSAPTTMIAPSAEPASSSAIAAPTTLVGPGAAASAVVPPVLPLGWRLRAPTTAADVAADLAAPPVPAASPLAISTTDTRHAAMTPSTPGWPNAVASAVPSSTPVRSTVEAAPISAAPALASTGSAPPPAPDATASAAPRRDAAPLPIVGTSAASVTPATAAEVAPATPPTLLARAAPAAQASAIVFGAARYAAQSDERRDEPLAPLGATVVGATAPAHVAAATLPGQAPIDVRHERWPTAMIERIEMIRDAANEADTRIRLVPDALGAIDVAVRRDGDTLHVRFAAEQPQTRALLQDAAPRLADAAEARGLRLGQTTVGGEGGGLAQQQQQQGRQQPLPSAPVRAPRPMAEAKADADDTRLA